MRILSRKEMYFYDKYTIETLGVPALELMENAGKGCAEFIQNELKINHVPDFSKNIRILIFCGSGNNGGDGFVIARYLHESGYQVELILTGVPEKMSRETRDNYQRCIELKIPLLQINNEQNWQDTQKDLNEYNIIVDAIFGVGFQGTLKWWRKELITEMNNSAALTIAIDIASGTDADTGLAEDSVKADYTLTMAAFKYGHFLGEGREKAGETLVVDIGIPDELFEKFPSTGYLVTTDNVVYPKRSLFSHKGSYGKIGIIAGSPGFSGAAVMAARSALRSGAGLIKLYHPAGMETIFETALIEVMSHPIPQIGDMKYDHSTFMSMIQDLDALLLGPGIGTSKATTDLVHFLLKNWIKPLVIDADGLNIIAADPQLLPFLKDRLITPHIGEFARLSGKEAKEIMNDPIGILKIFNEAYGCSILLKSATTLYFDEKEIGFDISGNDGLSTGGSGDVLAGIIISFLGQRLPMKDAALSASFLLGTAAEKLAEIRKPASIIPTDIIEELFKF